MPSADFNGIRLPNRLRPMQVPPYSIQLLGACLYSTVHVIHMFNPIHPSNYNASSFLSARHCLEFSYPARIFRHFSLAYLRILSR